MAKTPLVNTAPLAVGSMQLAGRWHVRPNGQTYFSLEAKGFTEDGEPIDIRDDAVVSTKEDVVAVFTRFLELTKKKKL